MQILLEIIAGFGGGLMGAYMGALPAFIMTGVFAMAGGVLSAAGLTGGVEIAISYLAFGSFMGPHTSFAGGVAAAAYAKRKGRLESGADILTSLNGLAEPSVLLVGGLFGAMGAAIKFGIAHTPWLGAMTDQPGITVFILAILTRLLIGKSGLTGQYTGSSPRAWISTGKNLAYNLVLGGGIGIAIGFVAATIYNTDAMAWATVSGMFPIICFGFSAITLIFSQTGFAMPATHHITLISAYAAVFGIAAFGAGGALLAVLFGILTCLMGDFVGCTFNSYVDSHIDPPATTIFIFTIIIRLIGQAMGVF